MKSWGIGQYFYIDDNGKEETGYGYPWDGLSPADFFPDPECCSKEELENHAKAVEELEFENITQELEAIKQRITKLEEKIKGQIMSNKLKPCPFCGDKNPWISTSYDNDGSNSTWKYVKCIKCHARTGGKWFTGNNDCPQFYEEVRDEWNTRAENE